MTSDVCKACGHVRYFHQIGRGTGVPIGQRYCDDRHAAPCSCTKFVSPDVHLDDLRPVVTRGYDQAGWALAAKPTQWKVGVSADEWIEYVPAPSGVIPGWPQPTPEALAQTGPCKCGHSKTLHRPEEGYPHWGCAHMACWCEAYEPG